MRRAFGIGGAAALVALGIIWSIAASGPTAGPARLGRSGDNCSGQACRVASLTANTVTAGVVDAGIINVPGTVLMTTDLFLTVNVPYITPAGADYDAWLYFPSTSSVTLGATATVNIEATESGGTVLLTGASDIAFSAPVVTLSATNQDARWTPSTALSTCGGGNVGATRVVSVVGGSTRTRMCLCTSDNAGSPTYAWQNVASAAVGNTTTCP